MSDWQAELKALRAQTDAFAKTVAAEITITSLSPAVPASAPMRESMAPPQFGPIDWVGSERDEISKRVENFRAHQRRVACERESFATSVIAKMRQPGS
ncbi:hypothetical protein [Bradyrhizobium sp. WSM1417]|uniref:hypothetical protein n=1 Tax=Bradyrhizobium sp. WSM1417 TaxID=754500 RepID=UPI000487915F|nr:hypothetical protein [Bradyrhizobium sp. WSM1417]